MTYATAVELHAQEGSLLHGLDAVPRLAACYASRDKPRAAAVLLGTFEAAIAGLKLAEQPVMRQIRERHLDHQPTQLGADFHAALREGRDLFTAAGPSGVLAAVLKTLNALDETEGDRLEGRQAGAAHPVK